MRYKAIFLDFYGTLVHEDDAAIADITQKMSACSDFGAAPKEIASYWWSELRQLFENSYGANFITQRELERTSILKTLEYFQCENINLDIDEVLFNHWVKPQIFDDTLRFLSQNVLPVCIVSNIDRNDILQAAGFHGMEFENIITSEDAKAYKPRAEIFRMALEKLKVLPNQVLHVGDSLSSDIAGAYNCCVDSFWLNRKNRSIPHDCLATYIGNTLQDVLKYCT